MGTLLLFLGLICGIWAVDENVAPTDSGAPHMLFPPNSELMYDMNLLVSTGISTPTGHTSLFGIHGTLNIRTGSQLDGVTFKVDRDNITITSYNGEGSPENMPDFDCSHANPGDFDFFWVGSMFMVNYNQGMITDIQLEKDERAFTRNMKRAIAQQFQIDLKQLKFENTPTIFTSNENGLWGECEIENTMTTGWKEGTYKLTKGFDSNKCPNIKYMWENNLNLHGDLNTVKLKSPWETRTERRYILSRPEGRPIQVDKIRSTSITLYQEPTETGEVYYHLVNQTFRLLDIIENEDGVTPDTSQETFDLVGELPTPGKLAPGTGPDFTLGRTPVMRDWDTHKAVIFGILDKMADYLEELPSTDIDLDKFHSNDLHDLLWNLRKVDTEYMELLSLNILDKESDVREETRRSIYLSVLPLVGTHAAILEIKRLVLHRPTLSYVEMVGLLEQTPHHVIGGDAKLLNDLKELIIQDDGVTTEAVLAFASLVGKVCSKPGVCTPDLIEEYVKKFYQRLADSDDYEFQVLCALALGNIGLAPVADYLEPLVRGSLSKDYSHRLRTIAASAAKSAFMARGPEKVYSTFWPILADSKAHLELRVIAISYLMESEPSSSRYLSIFSRLKKEHNPQLYNFFYTSVKALASTNNPLFTKMSHAARRIARYLPVPHSPRHAHTARYLLDLPFLSTEGEFSTAQITTVADPDTGIMDLAHLNILSYNYGLHHSVYSAFLRMDGLVDFVKNFGETVGLDENDAEIVPENIKKLISLGIKPREQQKSHVEFIAAAGGRVHFHVIVNNTWTKPLQRDMSGLLRQYFIRPHRNSQRFAMASSQHGTVLNDLGLTFINDISKPSLTSIRGNASRIENGINIQYDVRYRNQGSLMHMTLNPINGLWHGVNRQDTSEVYIPFAVSVTSAEGALKLDFTWNKDMPLFSAVRHARTQTFVGLHQAKKLDLMKKVCPAINTGLKDVTVEPRRTRTLHRSQFIDNEMELSAEIFECEQSQAIENRPNIIANFLSKGKINIPTNFKGNCGLKIAVMSIGDIMSADFEFRFAVPPSTPIQDFYKSFKFGMYIFYNSENVTISSYAFTFETEQTLNKDQELTKYNVFTRIVQITHDGGTKFVLCFEDETNFSEDGLQMDTWGLLYDSSNKRPLSRTMGASWGMVDRLSAEVCAVNEKVVWISGLSEATERDLTVWPHAQCEADKGDGEVYPATAACGLAADYAYGNRNFNVTVKQRNLISPKLQSLLPINESVTLGFSTSGPDVEHYTLSTPEGANFHSSMGAGMGTILDAARAMLAYTPMGEGLSGDFTRGLGSRCTLAGDRVLTFDNSSVPVTLGDQWTLLAADCRNISTFSLYVRKIEGMKGLALLSLQPMGEILEITPTASGKPHVNFTSTDNKKATEFETNLVEESEDTLVLTSKLLRTFELVYSSAAVTVRAPMQLRGVMCGLCGDYDSTPEAPWSFEGPDGTHVAVENLVSVYTLKP